MEANVYLHRLPGWEAHSWGFHADDGCLFHGAGRGRAYALPWCSGDVIGICLDALSRQLSFYRNGMALGTAFEGVGGAPLHPCVGLRSRGARLRANLGARPFR